MKPIERKGIEPNVYAISRMPTIHEIKDYSANVPGFVWVGGYFVTHNPCGRKPCTFFLHEPELPEIQGARKIVGELTGLEPKWGYSAMARQVCEKWLGIHQRPLVHPEQICPKWHYTYIIPSRGRFAIMYDLVGAYWQMAYCCPSPIVHFGPENRVHFEKPGRKQAERWNLLREKIRHHKRLRLALVGVNSVGWKGEHYHNVRNTICFHKGERFPMTGMCYGSLMPLSMLCVRATYEVVQIQTERAGVDAVYSNGDCVTMEEWTATEGPTYWQELGLKYEIEERGGKQAKGEDDIRSLATYRIGECVTKSYLNPVGPRGGQPIYPYRLPEPTMHKNFLKKIA